MWLKTCLIAFACLTLFVTACGEDGGTDSTTTTSDTSGTSGSDTSGSTSGTSGSTDTSGTSGNDGTSGSTEDTNTSGTDTSGTSGGTLDPLNPTFPTDPAGYATDNAKSVSYVKSLVIPENGDEGPTCCDKFDGSLYPDEEFDNGLAYLAPLIEGQLKDENGNPQKLSDLLTDQIASGTVTILWDHIQLDGADDADGFVLAGLLGAFAEGTTFDGAGGTKNASTGAGEFLINASSFKAGTGEPIISFDPVSMSGGDMQAGPGPFTLNLPILGFDLSLQVSETRITGEATISAEGVTYANGTLSGYVKIADIFGALNEVAGTCDCLGLNGGDLIALNGDKWECTIATTAFEACAGNEVSLCDTLSGAGQVCGFLGVITGVLDIDTDGDTKGDALSLGLQWDGVTGSVTGIAPESAP